MSRALNDLDPALHQAVFEMLARFTEQTIAVCIVDTLRTPEEHAQNLATGHSWTKHSKHLPNERGKSMAIDVCPYSTYLLHGADKLQWDAKDPVWQKMGEIGESVGLKWGGRWPKRDLGHFEMG